MEQEASRIIFEVMLGFTEISMFIVGEMLAILLSSKASRVGIMFLNQSISIFSFHSTLSGIYGRFDCLKNRNGDAYHPMENWG